jgi:hypothetical protein
MRTDLYIATRLAAMAGLILLVGAIAFAEAEPTTTPTPKPTPTGKQSLNEVAKDKKLNKEAAGESDGPIVISNENLDDYASKGELTHIKGSIKNVAEGPHAAGVVMVDPDAQQAEQRKYYWQQLYAQQMAKIASIKRQIQQLDRDIPGLWNDFYSRDDPAYRDGVVKPRLDDSLRKREELESQLSREEPKLGQIKEDARRDGAEPGWFREMKFAPTPRPKK